MNTATIRRGALTLASFAMTFGITANVAAQKHCCCCQEAAAPRQHHGETRKRVEIVKIHGQHFGHAEVQRGHRNPDTVRAHNVVIDGHRSMDFTAPHGQTVDVHELDVHVPGHGNLPKPHGTDAARCNFCTHLHLLLALHLHQGAEHRAERAHGNHTLEQLADRHLQHALHVLHGTEQDAPSHNGNASRGQSDATHDVILELHGAPTSRGHGEGHAKDPEERTDVRLQLHPPHSGGNHEHGTNRETGPEGSAPHEHQQHPHQNQEHRHDPHGAPDRHGPTQPEPTARSRGRRIIV